MIRIADNPSQSGLALLEPLDTDEKQELARHEAIIKRYAEAYADVGEALLAIRDQRLYRETHKTFEAYCDERLGFTKGHANHLIKSVAVVKNLASIDVKPKNLAQTRPLARLATDQQQQAWTVAQEKAAGKEVTAADLEQAAAKIAPRRRGCAQPPVRTPEQIAKAKKDRERREQKQKLEQERQEQKRREAWEKTIRVVRSKINTWDSARVSGTDLELVIASVVKEDPEEGDVALFRAGRLIATVIFKDGSPVVVRRDELEGGSK